MDEVLVSHKWTRNEIADCIKDCSCISDNKTIDSLAEKLRTHLKSVLDDLASGIDMVPAGEPAASLYKLGVELPSCNNCGHYDGVTCDYYREEKRRRDWANAVNCEQYLSPHPWGTERRNLRYVDSETGRYAEFQYEIIALGFSENFPDAHLVVEALRKDPEWSNRLDDVWKKVDEKESPGKWKLAR